MKTKQTCLVRNVRVERRQDDDVGWSFGNNVCDCSIYCEIAISPRKLFPFHEVVKQYSLCCPNTVGKRTLRIERVVFVDYRMDGFNNTKPYDACVVVAYCLRCDEPHHRRSYMCCYKRVVVLAVEIQSRLYVSHGSAYTARCMSICSRWCNNDLDTPEKA